MVSSLENLCIYKISNYFLQFKNELQYLPNSVKIKLLQIAGRRKKLLEDITLLRNLLHNNTEIISFSYCSITDEMLNIVSSCHNLRKFTLGEMNKQITLIGFQDLLPNLVNLEFFTVKGCDAMNDDLVQVMVESCPKLSTLDMTDCKNITDGALLKLRNLKLYALNISGTNVTDEGITNLLTGICIESLSELNICRCPVSEKSVTLVIQLCKGLSIFTFQDTKFKGDFNAPDNSNLKQLSWTIL